jgi:hypothetical protein
VAAIKVAVIPRATCLERVQLRAQVLMKRYAEREVLYAEFIVETSKRFADAWSHHAESPEVVAGVFSAVERMRLTSFDAVIVTAERVTLNILEALPSPTRASMICAEVYTAISFPISSETS